MKIRHPLLACSVALTFASMPNVVMAQQSSGPPAITGSLSTSDPTFSDGRRYDARSFSGRAGQEVTLILESDQFDPVLWVVNSSGQTIAYNDDANNSTYASLVQLTLPYTGSYTAVFTSYSNRNTLGSYRYAYGQSRSSSAPVSSTSSSSASDGSSFSDWAALGILGLGLLWWATSGDDSSSTNENLCPYQQSDGTTGWYSC